MSLFIFIIWVLLVSGLFSAMLVWDDWFSANDGVREFVGIFIILFLISPFIIAGHIFYGVFKLIKGE